MCGYVRSYLSKCVIFWPYDVLCICSSPKSVSQGWRIYPPLVPRAAPSGLYSHGLHVYWVWVENVGHSLLQQVMLSGLGAGLQCRPVVSVYSCKSKKGSGFQVWSFPWKNISPKCFCCCCCCWAWLLYKITEIQSLQQCSCVAWKSTGTAFSSNSVHCLISLLVCIFWSSKNFTYKCNILSVINYHLSRVWLHLFYDECCETGVFFDWFIGFVGVFQPHWDFSCKELSITNWSSKINLGSCCKWLIA